MYTARKTDNLRKTGKNDRFPHGIFFKFLWGVELTSEITTTKVEQNRMYTAQETGKLRKKPIKNRYFGRNQKIRM